jgi:hypothetical protein
MKELKQRFTQWYNRRMGRKGTLWEEHFKRVLVEGDEKALMTVAAYIDLNPVRAGMVERVEDYRWFGYGSAVAGNRWAREGLRMRTTGPAVGSSRVSNWLFKRVAHCPSQSRNGEGWVETGVFAFVLTSAGSLIPERRRWSRFGLRGGQVACSCEFCLGCGTGNLPR